MISVIGPEDTKEYAAAKHIEALITSEWPAVGHHPGHDVRIIAAAKCYGEETRDIDLVVFGRLAEQYAVYTEDSARVLVRNFCLAIELKAHSSDAVRFKGNQVEVRYREGWKPASEQSERQQIALRNYLKREGIEPPYVINLIWLRGVPESKLPPVRHNMVGGDASWETFLRRVVANKKLYESRDRQLELRSVGESRVDDLRRAADVFTKEMKPTALDRKKMEGVSKKLLRDQRYGEKLGQQLLIFRGRGGTGKTAHLLKLAHDVYTEQDARVLILTYNKALVADIRRLLTLMNVSDDLTEKSIVIQTVHKFIYHILKGLGLLPHPCEDFIENYEGYKADALELLRGTEPGEIEGLVRESNSAFSWDYVFIDEGQDWPPDERDLLFSVYDFRRFVVADGVDQLVRSHAPVRWREKIDLKDSQIVTLKKSLRLKAGLCNFAQAFAARAGLESWNVEPNYDVHGGRVLIVEGGYTVSRELHDELLARNKQAGNEPVDVLFCVPPGGRVDRDRHSALGEKFKEWGYKVWDAVADSTRETYPTALDQLRVVQYESCRGLEGWVVVNTGFDELYEYKVRAYEPMGEEARELFFDRDKRAEEYARRWLMIPLTRAVDTLVIQISRGSGFVRDVLAAAARDCGEIVEWRVVK